MPERWTTGLVDSARDVDRVERIAPGVNGAVVLMLDEATAAAQADAVDAMTALASGLEAIGLAIRVLVTLPGDRDVSRHNTIVLTDRGGGERYRREVRRSVAIDLHDLIEHVGDVADGD